MPDRQQLFWLFFRLPGRVSRGAYALSMLLLIVIQCFLLYRMMLSLELDPATQTYQMGPDAPGTGWAAGFWLFGVASLWPTVALTVKRLHDIGAQGIFAASLFIPALNLAAFLALCLIPGTSGPNRYGAFTNSAG